MLVFSVYIPFFISRVRPVHSFFEKKSILENPSQIFTNLLFNYYLQNYIVLPGPDRDDTKLLNFRIVSKHVFPIPVSQVIKPTGRQRKLEDYHSLEGCKPNAPLLFLVLDELEDRDVGILLLAVNIEPSGNHR